MTRNFTRSRRSTRYSPADFIEKRWLEEKVEPSGFDVEKVGFTRAGLDAAAGGAGCQPHGPVEFPSLEIAKACYADPAYQEAKRFALKASNRVLVMFGGDLG
jgi:hypothetical protein